MSVELDERAWQEWRRGGVGGSEVAALLGLSSYDSAVSLYFRKIGLLDDEEREESERQRIGHRMERVLAEEFHDRTGLYVVGEQTWCEHPAAPHRRATVDGFASDSLVDRAMGHATDALGVVEFKTDGRFSWPDGVPPNIRAQVVWQMGVTGLEHAWVVVMFAGFKVEVFEIAWDADAIADWRYMTELADRFWNDNVLAGVAPAMDDSDATTEALTWVHREIDPDALLDADDEGRRLVDAVQTAQRRRIASEGDEKRLKNELRAYLGEHTDLIDGWTEPGPRSKKPPQPNVLATWRKHTAERIDTKAFRSAMPITAARFTTTTESRTLRLGKSKES